MERHLEKARIGIKMIKRDGMKCGRSVMYIYICFVSRVKILRVYFSRKMRSLSFFRHIWRMVLG